MIRLENRYDNYAYRLATFELDPTVTNLDEGQWVTLKNGKLVISDGTQKSFIAMGSHRAGRDQIGGIPVKKISVLYGNFVLTVDNFDAAGIYGDMTPLKIKADGSGVLTPATGTDTVVAYAVSAPVDGFLRIISK